MYMMLSIADLRLIEMVYNIMLILMILKIYLINFAF